MHVWANCLHLVWTTSIQVMLLPAMVAYGIARAQEAPAPVPIPPPYLATMAFFAVSCASPYAIRTHATGVGVLVPGVGAASLGVVAYVLGCYRPGPGSAVACLACALGLCAALAWTKAVKRMGMGEWLVEKRGSGAYSLAIAAGLAVLLVIGIVTSAIL